MSANLRPAQMVQSALMRSKDTPVTAPRPGLDKTVQVKAPFSAKVAPSSCLYFQAE